VFCPFLCQGLSSDFKSHGLPSPRPHGCASILQNPVLACQSLHIRISSEHRNAPRHPAHLTLPRNLPRCAPTGRPKGGGHGQRPGASPAPNLGASRVTVAQRSRPSPATRPAGAAGVSSRKSNARKAWGFASPPHWTFGIVSVGIGLKLIFPSRRQSNPATPSPNTPHRTKAEPQNPRCTRDKAIQKRKKPRRFLVRA
jgi:hypothetical protein